MKPFSANFELPLFSKSKKYIKALKRAKWPLLLYSTNTRLAYQINQRFYNGKHWVWCGQYIDAKQAPTLGEVVPPTSSAAEIYHSLLDEVTIGDLHSAKIKANKEGLKKGAEERLKDKIINKSQCEEICDIVDLCPVSSFRPVLYVIPFHLVVSKLYSVPVQSRAHPMSLEYIIKDLTGDCFDLVELARR